MKSKIDQRSDKAFSIGVPVRANLTCASLINALAFLVVDFDVWASSILQNLNCKLL